MISAGASGIGLAIATAFLEQGARVHVCDISDEALGQLKRQHSEIGVFRADVSDERQVAAWFEHAVRELDGLDVLVNNAGIAGPTAGIADITAEDWDMTMAVNVRSQYLCARQAVPLLRKAQRGVIINMSSIAGRLGYPLRTAYAASKWAVIGMTESLAIELGPDNISVNSILPGIVDSERARQVTRAKAVARNIPVEEMEAEILGKVALHRMVPMSDVAAMALFLASEAGRSITGQKLNVCAGIQSLS